MSKRKVLKIIIDFVCFLIVTVAGLLLYIKGRPNIRGFFCDDQSIRYPLVETIVSDVAVVVIGIVLPIILIIIAESLDFCYLNSINQTPPKVNLIRLRIHPIIWNSYSRFGVYLFGYFMTFLVTILAKNIIGTLRPHFISACNPELPDPCIHEYIQNVTCRGNRRQVIYARQAFPSGHASTAAYCMLYLTIYLQVRFRWKGSIILKPFLQFGLLCSAMYIGLTRIVDNNHHWYDTLCGFALGIASAILVAIFLSDLIRPYKKTITSENLENSDLRKEGSLPFVLQIEKL